MPRRNVYLPDDLDGQVQQLGLPMSEICQRALRAEVRSRQAQAIADGDLAVAAARLLSDRDAAERADYEEGFAVGRGWAQREARWSELSRFEPHRGRPRDLVMLDGDHTLRSTLFSWAISHDYEVDEDMFTSLDRDHAFDRGVIDGATQVLLAVLPVVADRVPESDE